MFLTGFDSKTLNTLYVDKNLRFHGLIQAFSRTNRTLDERKSHGNIVCFRNLKDATDEAIRLFSDKDAKEEIILKPYIDYVKKFNETYKELIKIVPTIDSVDDLPSEVEQLAFIQKFRELLRIKNIISTFAEFEDVDLQMPVQNFEDYKSKYLDLYDSVKNHTEKEKTSILNDVDFELELIHRDEINVAYILKLLATYKQASQAEQEKKKKEVLDLLEGQTQLRSKRQLIEKFIAENLPHIEESEQIESEFENFWSIEKEKAITQLCEVEKVNQDKFKDAISEYLFSQRLPLPNQLIDMLEVKPNLLGIKIARERLKNKIIEFVNTFIEGV
jgi:type I restriction enzyme R subunit